MYIPKYYRINEKNEIYNFIHKNSFAILVSRNNGKLVATHLPVLIKENEGENGLLYGHIAKANLQWKDIEDDVLVIFPGVHKYISSSWYETNQSVPTWNYLSVHVYGKIKFLDDNENKIRIIRETVKFFENEESAYKVDDLKKEYFEGLLKGIIAFRVEITAIEGKQKISQNHSEERQQRVINELGKFDDENSREIVERMKNNIRKKDE